MDIGFIAQKLVTLEHKVDHLNREVEDLRRYVLKHNPGKPIWILFSSLFGGMFILIAALVANSIK